MDRRDPEDGLEPYDWVAWLSGADATVLLQHLLLMIESDGCTVATLQRIVQGWRENAHDALTNNDYKAEVDGYLEIHADARLFLWRTGRAPHEHTLS